MRGKGEYHRKLSAEVRAKILGALLFDDWTRFKTLQETTDVSPASLSKYLPLMVDEGIVERLVDQRTLATRYRHVGRKHTTKETTLTGRISKLKEYDDEILVPDNIRVYSDLDLGKLLSEDSAGEVSDLLHRIQGLYSDILIEITLSRLEIMESREYLGKKENLAFYQRNYGLYDSLERRYERSGVAVEESKSVWVFEREAEFLGRFSRVQSDLEGDHFLWMRLNRFLRDVPLSRTAYEKYLDLKKVFEEPDGSIRDFLELIESEVPLLELSICPEKIRGQ